MTDFDLNTDINGGSRGKHTANGKVLVTSHVYHETVEKARNTVYWMGRDHGIQLTLTGLYERGLRLAIAEYEKNYNGGKPFAKRAGPLRSGPASTKPRTPRRISMP